MSPDLRQARKITLTTLSSSFSNLSSIRHLCLSLNPSWPHTQPTTSSSNASASCIPSDSKSSSPLPRPTSNSGPSSRSTRCLSSAASYNASIDSSIDSSYVSYEDSDTSFSFPPDVQGTPDTSFSCSDSSFNLGEIHTFNVPSDVDSPAAAIDGTVSRMPFLLSAPPSAPFRPLSPPGSPSVHQVSMRAESRKRKGKDPEEEEEVQPKKPCLEGNRGEDLEEGEIIEANPIS